MHLRLDGYSSDFERKIQPKTEKNETLSRDLAILPSHPVADCPPAASAGLPASAASKKH